jgi:acyl-coenzyme A thioesterase PaaI-like protein
MDGGEQERVESAGLVQVAEGPWAGWSTWVGGDPFEDQAGPFYWRKDPDGRTRCAFRAEAKHMNGGGFMHGGCIMTFADYSLFVIAREALADSYGVTATFNGEFVGSVHPGDLVECTGEIVKAGRSMIFLRGLVTTGAEPVMSFSAVIKKTRPRNAG